MSDVQMPEPVGWLHICRKKPTYRTFSFREKVKELAVLGYFPFPVITTTQAQAYADARVREALEDLIDTLETRQFGGQDQIIRAIHALIPPQQ